MKSEGSKIKRIATVFESVVIVGSVLGGLFLGGYVNETSGNPIVGGVSGIFIIVFGVVVSKVVGAFLSGFGELVESAFEIKMNVYYMRKSQVENNRPQSNTANCQEQQPMYWNNANQNFTNNNMNNNQQF